GRPVAVEVIEALAGAPVVRIVVVRLVRCNPLLVEEWRGAAVLHDEHHVILVTLIVGKHGAVDAARPIARNRQRVARGPVALDLSRGRVGGAEGLLEAGDRADMQTKPRASASVPAEAVAVDRVVLCRV